MNMNYDTLNGTIDKVNEAIENLKKLLEYLNEDTLSSDVCKLDDINGKIVTMIDNLQTFINDELEPRGSKMKFIDEMFNNNW